MSMLRVGRNMPMLRDISVYPSIFPISYNDIMHIFITY